VRSHQPLIHFTPCPSVSRYHAYHACSCLVQTGLNLKSPFNSNGFRPGRSIASPACIFDVAITGVVRHYHICAAGTRANTAFSGVHLSFDSLSRSSLSSSVSCRFGHSLFRCPFFPQPKPVLFETSVRELPYFLPLSPPEFVPAERAIPGSTPFWRRNSASYASRRRTMSPTAVAGVDVPLRTC
jgi:hypothetical protein